MTAPVVIESPWMSVPEIALYLRIGRRTARREIAAGRLKAARIGGRGMYLSRKDWCDEWVHDRLTPVLVVPRSRVGGSR